MKKTTKRLALHPETVRVLAGRDLTIVAGGVIDQGSGEAHCPTTVGYPGCESVACPGPGPCHTLWYEGSCWPDPS